MAIADSYATAAQYRAGIDQDDTSEDAEILEYLTAISRIIEKKTGRVFNIMVAVGARSIDAKGGDRLWLPDFATVTGLLVAVDTTGDFTFDLSLTINTDFRVGPRDALSSTLTPEELPARFLDINPNSSNLSGWPDREESVEVTAKFGWPAVPVAIQKGAIAMTKQLRDATKQPFTLTLESLENEIQMSPGASRIIKDLVREYGKGVVNF